MYIHLSTMATAAEVVSGLSLEELKALKNACENMIQYYTTQQVLDHEADLIKQGQKFQAVKSVRDRLGISVRAAKEIVEHALKE